jgi:hypothetical protein
MSVPMDKVYGSGTKGVHNQAHESDREAATLQTYLATYHAACRPPYPAGLFGWALAALQAGDTPLQNGQTMEELAALEREHFGDPDTRTGIYAERTISQAGIPLSGPQLIDARDAVEFHAPPHTDVTNKMSRVLCANVKLAGALDMVRETLYGATVDDLVYIINTALAEHRILCEED